CEASGDGFLKIPTGFSPPAQGCEVLAGLATSLPWVRRSKSLQTLKGFRQISDMPQSLSAVYIHLVFSTKERRPFLRNKIMREKLHAELGGISKNLECPPILIGGVVDHVHLLCRFGRKITQAEWVKEIKRASNVWLKEQGRDYSDFEWQGGYSDFSVSQSNL